YPWSAESEFIGADVGASVGYRSNSNALVYVGAAYQTFETSGHVHQAPSKWGDSSGDSADLPKKVGDSETVQTGYQFGELDQFTISYSYSHVDWYGLHDDIFAF